jgi:hypothetical protein
MRRIAGQAAVRIAWLLHHVSLILLATAVIAGVGLGALSWRLSQGPLDIAWLARLLEFEAKADDGGAALHIGHAALAWEGFSKGVDRPLDLRLSDVTVTDEGGHRRLRIPRAELSLSVAWLLLGHVVPRAIAIDGAQVNATRDDQGGITLDIGDLGGETRRQPQAGGTQRDAGRQDASEEDAGRVWAALMQEFSLPPQSDAGARRSHWSQLRRVLVRDATLTLTDQQLGLQWQVPRMDMDLRRAPQGGVDGSAHLALAAGDQQATLDVTSHLRADGSGTSVHADLRAIRPADIAAGSPLLHPLADLDAPVTLTADADFAADLSATKVRLQAQIGQGSLSVGAGRLPFAGAALTAVGDTESLTVTLQRLQLASHESGPPTIVHGKLVAHRDGEAIVADVGIDLDRVAFADLPSLWPVGVGGKGTRPWIGGNITSGLATNGHVQMGLRMANPLSHEPSHVQLTSISGGLDGHDVTVHWLRPVPPIQHAEAHLAFVSPDAILITFLSGQESGGALALQGGDIRITGLSEKDQFADIDADIAGPLADLLTVLRNPRLKLLDRRPITMNNPSGHVAGHLSIIRLPLEDNVTVDDLKLQSTAHLTYVHLGGIAGGQDLDHGTIDITASNDGLTAQGPVQIATIPVSLRVDLDFRGGPPSEVLQKIAVAGTLDGKQLVDRGLLPAGLFTGPAYVTGSLQTLRNGHGDIAVQADLARAAINLAPLAWIKTAGAPATAELHATLEHDHLTSIDRLTTTGDGIDVRAKVDVANGHPIAVHLQRVELGHLTSLHGDIAWPSHDKGWLVRLTGSGLALTDEPKPASHKTPSTDDLPAGTVDIQLDRLQVGSERSVNDLVLRGTSDGTSIRDAHLTGRVGEMPFAFAITPAPAGRTLSGSVSDIGALLRAVGISKTVEGGRLDLSGAYDEKGGGKTLTGRAEVGPFHVRGAPAMAKILQGLTLYGLVDALQGPGLAVSRLVAPFKLTGNTLDLIEARASSSSLGATVKGVIDLDQGRCELQGTIVPLYFFNSLPGKIPLVGRLFSPESGGGLFAATFGLHGPCDDPDVGINPLATLTPGFLRGLFSVFDSSRN